MPGRRPAWPKDGLDGRFWPRPTIAAAVYTLDPHELCCGMNAYAQTARAESFELKKVGDGVWAAVAAARYKVNSNAAVIETNDGLVIVDTHSKPSAARALYKEIQGVSKKPVRRSSTRTSTGITGRATRSTRRPTPGLEIITTEQTKAAPDRPNVRRTAACRSSRSRSRPAGRDREAEGRHPEGADAAAKARLESNLRPGRVATSQELKSHQADAADAHRVADDDPAGGRPRDPAACPRPRPTPTATCSSTCRRRRCVATGDAVVDWMPFLNDGYPEEWVADGRRAGEARHRADRSSATASRRRRATWSSSAAT